MRLLLLLVLSGLAACSHAPEERSTSSPPTAGPSVPDALAPPAGVHEVRRVVARGTQNYACTAAPGGPAWKLTAPEAVLFESDAPGSPEFGAHGAGPSWTARDGSRVLGDGSRVQRVASPDAASVPWLLVPAADSSAPGVLNGVTFVQRLDTRGGAGPQAGCDATTVGQTVKVPYTATYVFFRPGT